MKITDEAVEAAHTAANQKANRHTYVREMSVRAALEAALPHLSQGAVRVKSLEWSYDERWELWSAETPFGDNELIHFVEPDVSAPNGFWEWNGSEREDDEYPTLDAAKAAAQADYERRILSALSLAPVGVTDEMRRRGKEALQVMNRRKMTCAEMAGVVLDAAFASHEPAPTDTQERLSEAGETDGLDAVDLDMIRRGDRLGTRLGETVFQALIACQQEVERLRNLDQEYGRVEMAIIMSDPAFDGDGPHDNCGDRLIASVRNLKNRAEAAEARADALERALEFYADVSKYPAPLTGGMGDLWLDCGERARAAIASTGGQSDES